ncbi:Csu type fimbrial protein [Sphingomonas adhaesiva]|uniref:Csu type fimbrial protein n=1 Tax=Sphingomonas adhaesiva TaxID=28212 RepID=UPI002FF6220A
MSRTAALAAAAAVAVAALSPAAASADTATGTIAVALTVTNACVVNGAQAPQASLGSLGDINFPDQPGIFGNVDGQLVGSLGALQILCSPGVAPQLTIGAGSNDAAGKRRMASSGNMLDYRLFTDAQRTSELTIGSRITLGTASTTPFSVPIYARVNSGGAVIAAGRYTDTVQVTLSW